MLLSLSRALDRWIDAVPPALWAVAVALCTTIIIAAGLRPANDLKGMSVLPPGHDKVLHALAYAGLAACMFRLVYPRRAILPPRMPLAWMAVLAWPALVGALDEFLQGYVQRGRSRDIYDWCADVLGAAIALGLGLWLRERARRGQGPYQSKRKY